MGNSEAVESQESRFSAVLAAAVKLPGVRIDREAYLRAALSRHCSAEDVARAVASTPASAGIPIDVIDRVANESIRYETAKATVLSAAAGVPGVLGMIATVPADFVQYLGHVLRVAQKLAYLYSWPDLFSGEGEGEDGSGGELDDATRGMLILFVGVMFGAQSANAAVGRVSGMVAEQVLKKLPQRALTQGVIYPVVKKVAGRLGVQMTKQIFAKGVAKVVPIVGAVVSGGFTFATFHPMAKRLQKHLAGSELTRPAYRAVDVIDGEVLEDPDGDTGQLGRGCP